jgi:uncharacterized Fe-S radical SAM superfamily protein PflX
MVGVDSLWNNTWKQVQQKTRESLEASVTLFFHICSLGCVYYSTPITWQVTSFQVWIFIHQKKRTNSAHNENVNFVIWKHNSKTTATEWWMQATLEHTRVPHRILSSSYYDDDDLCHMVQVVVVVVVLPT